MQIVVQPQVSTNSRLAAYETAAVETYDTIVLGAGATGLTVAAQLSQQPGSLCVVDEYDDLGGNHKSRQIAGYSFDIGAFVFKHDDLPFAAFPEAQRLLKVRAVQVAKLRPDGHISAYPYTLKGDLLGKGPVEVALSALSLLWGKVRYRRPRDAAEYAMSFMGARIYQTSGLAHYISRLFGVDATTIELEFAQKRMGWIARAGSLGRHLRGTAMKPALPSQPAVRPVQGFSALYAPARQVLEARGVALRLGEPLERITREDGVFTVTLGDVTLRCRRLIASIPVQRVADLVGVGGAATLKNRDLTSLYFSFAGKRGFAESILYNFSLAGGWKRLTMHSDYYGVVRGREYFSVETPVGSDSSDTAFAAEQDFRQSIAAAGLFAGDLRLEGSERTKYAYPIYTGGATEAAAALIAEMERIGVEFAGRQGRFDYTPTANQAAVRALKDLDRRAS